MIEERIPFGRHIVSILLLTIILATLVFLGRFLYESALDPLVKLFTDDPTFGIRISLQIGLYVALGLLLTAALRWAVWRPTRRRHEQAAEILKECRASLESSEENKRHSRMLLRQAAQLLTTAEAVKAEYEKGHE